LASEQRPRCGVRWKVSDGGREEVKGVNRSEFRYGAPHRSVRLPVNADEEHVTAKGILEVTVPLTAPQPAGRKVPITVP
jgi:HSP20 family protein